MFLYDPKGADQPLFDMKFVQNILIHYPVQEIFAYISDIENLVDWASTVISVRKLSPQVLGVGTTIKTTTRFLGCWMDVTYEVVEHEIDNSVTFKSISGVPCLFSYRFEPSECGGTILHQEAWFQSVKGLIDHASSVVSNALRRQLEYDLVTLKDIMEAREPAILPGRK
jgi:uncharacterized membrane protein